MRCIIILNILRTTCLLRLEIYICIELVYFKFHSEGCLVKVFFISVQSLISLKRSDQLHCCTYAAVGEDLS